MIVLVFTLCYFEHHIYSVYKDQKKMLPNFQSYVY